MTVHNQLRQRFEMYREEITVIKDCLAGVANPRDVDGYLDSGSVMHVVRLESDRSLVVKVPIVKDKDEDTPREVVRQQVKGLVPGMHKPRLEQIVAYNTDRRIKPYGLVSRFVEGPTLHELDDDARHAIPYRDYLGVLATFTLQQDLGLGMDRAPGNVKHNASGLIVLDYELNPRQPLAEKVAGFAGSYMLLEGTLPYDEVPEYGLRYRAACYEMFGSDMVVAVEKQWRREERLFTPLAKR